MDDLTKEFLAEGMDSLDRMERCLTDLEQRPGDRELMDEIFRAVHTIKGATGFLGYKRVELLAHVGENLLDSLREGRLGATAEVINGLLQLMDVLRHILHLIELTGGEGTRASDQDGELIDQLKQLNGEEGGPEEAPVVAEEKEPNPGPVAAAPAEPSLAQLITASPSGVSEQTLRVDVEVLNRMMNLVGELVLTRNQILQLQSVDPHFADLTRRLDSVTADLRETVMQARMQPVGHLFGKFPRMVRDLARSCGKNIRLEFSGQETGLDKSLLEAIKDPLAHAVRNAVDHGIEDPATRTLAGKPLEGVIRLQARQHNGSVLIEISDDGQGISIARVLAKAIARQLITPEQGAAMTEREVLNLVFLPGFSTLDTVTHLSGRGVGMDVVLANVEKAGGTVELESWEGVGTMLRLRVPLTLAIVPALVVQSGGQSFCLPQGSLAELIYVPERDAGMVIERMGQAELYRLRETLLPMLRLNRMLGLRSREEDRPQGFYLVVLETEGCRFGLMVDDILTPEEIVVKPLSAGLREIGLFSGATVLGNGTLAMIVDIAAIAARAGVGPSAEPVVDLPALAPLASAQESFLIFEDRRRGPRFERGFGQREDLGFSLDADRGTWQGVERRALPLRAVERIESVAASEVEYVGSLAVLRYRGELLALEDAGLVLAEMDSETDLTVLICVQPARAGGGERRFGIVVRSVLDVAHGELLDGTARVCSEQLALVNDRLSVVHERFSGNGVLEEVA